MLRTDPMFWLAVISCLVVLVILLIGIGGFARGGDFNAKHANRLMRYRIAAQGFAVLVIVLFAWLRSR